MQQGSVIREHRKLGPDVWCFRWWEAGPNGNRVHRRIVLGTAEQMRDAASARQLTFGLVQEINTTDIRSVGISMTLAQLADHFHQRELGRSNGRISYSTKRAYQGYLDKWIVPRWGDCLLPNIKAVEVELWLKHLERAAGTCCKIRNVMSVLFNHARRYDLYDRNPIQWVRQSAKRRSTPEVLTSNEVRQLLTALKPRERMMVLLDVATGLRQSELFALKWKDVDFKNRQLWVTRAIVQQVVGNCKTEASQKPVPLHDYLISALRGWHRRTTISNAGELGVRQSQETRKNPILGTATSSTPHPPRSAKAGHNKADWLAHISQNLLDTSPCNGCGTEGDAGTGAAFNNPRHSRHLHSSGHHGKAICADSCR
jgi:integrase